MPIQFNASPDPTIGVEVELQIVDPTTRQLVAKSGDLIAGLNGNPHVKSELLQSTVELNTSVCRNAKEVRADLEHVKAEVQSACEKLGGEALDDDKTFWHAVREHQRPFFTATDRPLWRISLPPAAPMLDIDGDCVIDWGGAQRWLQSDMDAVALRRVAKDAGGHASVYRGDARPRFHPIGESIMALQQRLKKSMDPAGILNPGRIYPEL